MSGTSAGQVNNKYLPKVLRDLSTGNSEVGKGVKIKAISRNQTARRSTTTRPGHPMADHKKSAPEVS
jgi:flagellar basal body rod protein FlgC